MNIKAENLLLSTDHTTQMKHYHLKIFTLPSIIQKINQLCCLNRIENLYLNQFSSRRKQSTSIILWVPVAQQYWTDSSLYNTLTFCWLNRLFSCGNKRFVVFEVLKFLALSQCTMRKAKSARWGAKRTGEAAALNTWIQHPQPPVAKSSSTAAMLCRWFVFSIIDSNYSASFLILLHPEKR